MTDLIQLFVRSGSNRNTIIEVHKDASVDDLVSKITEWNGIDEASQRVLFAGRELQMVKDLKDRSHLFVVFQLPGGNDPDAQEEPFGNSNYGNDVCTDEDPILKILKEAPLKEIVGLKGCPSIRACPKCGSLIEHTKDCKHMVCVCGQEFCFICLNKPGAYSNYCCGFFKCTIAPIQDMIGITDEVNDETSTVTGNGTADDDTMRTSLTHNTDSDTDCDLESSEDETEVFLQTEIDIWYERWHAASMQKTSKNTADEGTERISLTLDTGSDIESFADDSRYSGDTNINGRNTETADELAQNNSDITVQKQSHRKENEDGILNAIENALNVLRVSVNVAFHFMTD